MVDAVRSLRTGALLAACGLRILCRRRAANRISTSSRCVARTATCRPAVNDGNRELVGAHVDDADRIVGNRALRVSRVFQHGLNVFVGNHDGVLRRLSQSTNARRHKYERQDLRNVSSHGNLLYFTSAISIATRSGPSIMATRMLPHGYVLEKLDTFAFEPSHGCGQT